MAPTLARRMVAPDIFKAGPAGWEADPITTFDTWLSQQPGRLGSERLQASSAGVYRSQWRAFLAYTQNRRLHLAQVEDRHIADFLATLDSVNRSQRERLRKLLERVFTAMQVESRSVPAANPAVGAVNDGRARWRTAASNRPTTFLTRAERLILIDHLMSPILASNSAERWRELRDRALAATFLGAGLKRVEAQRLTVKCVRQDLAWINVHTPTSLFSHRTAPAPFARELIAQWLVEREQAHCLGDYIFAVNPGGRPMHSVTILHACSAVISAAGLQRSTRASPQTMRNTFAGTLFEAGESTKSVSDSLGFASVLSAVRLKAAWQQHAWQTSEASGRYPTACVQGELF